MMVKRAKDIGDLHSPLEVDLESIKRDHALVGKEAEVAPHAQGTLCDVRGKEAEISGVFLKLGQIVGYEVKVDGKVHYALPRDLYTKYCLAEDIHLDSHWAEHVRESLGHYAKQHDYHGPSWDGIENFYFELSKVTSAIVLESAGWYRYPSSSRSDMDGKDWRVLIPDFDMQEAVAVNCHSLLHDGVWTLSTTIFSTRDVDMEWIRGNLTGGVDHWSRAFQWTIALAEKLQSSGYDFTSVVEDLERRRERSFVLRGIVDYLLPLVEGAFHLLCGMNYGKLKPVSVGMSHVRVEPNHVGRYERFTDLHPYGIISLHPKAWGDQEYTYEILKHELIHHALNHLPSKPEVHGDLFDRMAKALNLPAKYRE